MDRAASPNFPMTDSLTCLITTTELTTTVQRLAQAIDRDYATTPPLLVGVLKGSFVFLADLVRHLQVPIQDVEFIQFSSYGANTVSSGQAELKLGIAPDRIAQQPVILVEDIVDTGTTTHTALAYLAQFQPASLRLCTLLDKPDRRRHPVTIDYLGLTVPNRFIVGYGIDFDEKYRQLPAIYALD